MKNQNSWPKISVITPSFNQGEFIEETIRSVISQNYPNLEYIIVDGGSTDNSVQIIKKYANKYPKIIRWVSEKDKGQSDAINKGLKMSTGEILCYLNSDDCFTSKALFFVAEFFLTYKEAYWLTGDYEIIDERGRKIQDYIRIYKKILRLFPSKFMIKIANFINQPSTFWKREIYNQVGELNLSYKYNMDYDYWLRIFKKGYKLYYLNKVLSKFRVHKQSKGVMEFEKQFKEDLAVLVDNFGKNLYYYLHLIHNFFIINLYKLLKK